MARPAFAGRRARSRGGQLAAFAAVVMLVTTALGVIGGAIAPILDAGTRSLVTQSGPTASAVRIEARLHDDAPGQDETLREAIGTSLRGLPADIVRTVVADTEATLDHETVLVQAYVDPAIAADAELDAGDWPAAADETAVQDAAAATLGMAVGDTLDIGPRTLTVTGIWHPIDPAAARWFGDPAVASGAEDGAVGPFLVGEAMMADLVDDAHARWTVVPGPEALGVAALPAMADSLARLDTELRRMGGGNDSASLTGTLADTVARATRVAAVATGVLGLPLVLVTVAGAIVLTLIARAIASGRGGEFVLLRARGASSRALAGAASREAAGFASIGAAAGAGAAVLVLRFGLPAVGATAEATPLALALGIAAAVAVLAVAAVTVVTVVELRAPVTGRAEAGRAAVIASLGPLALAAVAAGFAYAQFSSLGSPVLVRADGVVRTDPLALTAPVLVLVAAALAAPAIAGPIVAVAERFARAARGILPVLPLRQLARRARSVAAGVLVVALAAGAVVVVAAFHVGTGDARAATERAATGADLRLILPLGSSVEADRPGASAGRLEGVAGVDDAFAVLGTTASVGADAVPLIAADVRHLAALPAVDPDLVRFADRMVAGRSGSALPDGVTGLTVVADVTPGGGVPEGLSMSVVVWLADRDGAAVRVPLGAAPIVAGTAEVTGDIPPASTLLAVEFRPQSLPDQMIVDLVLGAVRTDDGGPIPWTGETVAVLTGSSADRLPAAPPTDEPLPVVLSEGLAARLNIGAGDEFAFRSSSIPAPIPAKVAGVVPFVPGGTDPLGMLIDLPTFEAYAVGLGGSVPAADELWVSSGDPDAAARSIRDALTGRAEMVTARSVSPGPVLDPTIALVELGVAVTVVLAVLGFAAVAASIGRRRRVELAPLRSLGLSVGRIRSARAIELVATAILAVVLGAAAGLLTAWLVVPGLVGVLA